MSNSNMHILEIFDVNSIPDLDVAVLGALELFSETDIPNIDLEGYSKPLVVGSGNAAATGKIIFSGTDAVFGTESSAEHLLQSIPSIDIVVIVSASGSKHAPTLVQLAHNFNKPVALITNTPKSLASASLNTTGSDVEYMFPKNREPYTYNTSTYMGMILGKTNEDPAAIQDFIYNSIDTITWPDFSLYKKYYLIVPTEFEGIIRLLNIKFIELFGREIARDIETSEYIKHATTVVPAENELFISLGVENTQWGESKHRLHIPFMENGNYAAAMAISYYTIGQIQKAYSELFKSNIVEYTAKMSEIFGSEIKPISE